MAIITLEDARRHQPPSDAPESWQESFFLGWYDAAARIGGHHHISLKPVKKSAHVWSWMMLDGKIVGRAQQHVLPLPSGDYDDLRIGVLHLTQGNDLKRLRLGVTFEDAAVTLDYQAFCHPLEVRLDTGGLVVGKRHYESMGHVTGAARIKDREIPILGGAWQDHSWGPRQFYAHRAGRWLFAVFGDDLAISVFTYVTPQGQKQFGWVFDRGVVYSVTRAVFNASTGDDGVSPRACDAMVWTEGGRGYRVQGEADASAMTGDAEWYSKDSLARFECGGRLGQGMLEINELKSLPPAMREELEI